MDGQAEAREGFEFSQDFVAGELSEGLSMGPLEAQYEELFAEVLEDGVITTDERQRLEKAADNLGLDSKRLLRLEQAMLAAYQAHHRVRIVEHYEEPVASLSPLRIQAEGDSGRTLLLKRIEQLEGRVRELEEELRRAQASINVEVDLSDLESRVEDASADEEDAWRRVRQNPRRAENLRALYRIYAARGEPDKLWCVAQALVLLGAANAEERATFERSRIKTLIRPTRSVSPSAWYDFLFHPEEELLTGQILAVITPAALLGRVSALRRDKQLYQPAPALRQDPASATAMAVRAIPWAAAVLGLAPPPIYVDKQRNAGYEHIPAVPPITVIGKSVLSGRGEIEHAFLVARHLTYYRQEHFIKTLFGTPSDLEDLFLAALTIGNPGLPIAEELKKRVAPLAQAVEPVLEPNRKDLLRGLFFRFVEEGGRTNLQRWSAAVDKTACRAGLLVSNDLLTAAELIEKEHGAGSELISDLIAFVTSTRYFELRSELGLSLSLN